MTAMTAPLGCFSAVAIGLLRTLTPWLARRAWRRRPHLAAGRNPLQERNVDGGQPAQQRSLRTDIAKKKSAARGSVSIAPRASRA
jgi:hypothetical protein